MLLRTGLLVLLTTLVATGSLAAAAERAGGEDGWERRRREVMNQVRTHLLGTGVWRTGTAIPTNRSVNDIGKHWWPRLLAELEADPSGSTRIRQADGSEVSVQAVMRGLCHHAPDDRPPASTNPAVGYLYFSPVGLGWVLHAFPDALAEEDRVAVFHHALRFDPTLSALNLFTGQGTENHMLMGRMGGYLICQAVVARGPDDPRSGALHAEARERLAQLKPYFLETARATFDRGFGEWDSSIYYPYVVSCWLGLHDYAADPEVRGAAKAVLDWIAATVALRTTQGVFGGPEQRSGMPLRSGQSNLDQLAWLWWGGLPGNGVPAWRGQDYGQLVYACLSRYRPPEPTGRLARKELPEEHFGVAHLETKPSYLTHGADSVRQQSRVVFFVERSYTLGSAVARPTGGWTGGDNQDLLWKLVARDAHPDGGAFVVCGPKGRDPWRQVAQWNGTLFDVWHRPVNADALREEAMAIVAEWRRKRGESLRRAFPADTSRENTVRAREVDPAALRAALIFSDGRPFALPESGPALVQLGDTYLAIRGVGAGLAVPEPGGYGGFVLETGSAREHGDFAAFARAVRARDAAAPPEIEGGRVRLRSLRGERLEFAHRTEGTYVEPEYDWGYGADDEGGHVIMAMPPFRFPRWPEGEGHGRVPRLTVDGEPIEARFGAAVYSGPNVTLADGELRVTDGRTVHRVNAQGRTESAGAGRTDRSVAENRRFLEDRPR